jgi:curved DNA-binding protein CbpA
MAKPYIDPYVALGLTRAATAAEIKQAYFALVRAHPPEREPEAFKRIRAAYERLRDPERRAETDMLLLNEWPEPARRRRPPRLDLTLHRDDVIAAARSLTDLARTDWREHYGKVKL